jgi:hypothetical protein
VRGWARPSSSSQIQFNRTERNIMSNLRVLDSAFSDNGVLTLQLATVQ